MQIDALIGREGMFELLRAFRFAGRDFDLGVTFAVPDDTGKGTYVLFTIGTTTAAMTIAETEWFAENLIHNSGGMGQLSLDLQSFGRTVRSVLAETPGPHGVH